MSLCLYCFFNSFSMPFALCACRHYVTVQCKITCDANCTSTPKTYPVVRQANMPRLHKALHSHTPTHFKSSVPCSVRQKLQLTGKESCLLSPAPPARPRVAVSLPNTHHMAWPQSIVRCTPTTHDSSPHPVSDAAQAEKQQSWLCSPWVGTDSGIGPCSSSAHHLACIWPAFAPALPCRRPISRAPGSSAPLP